MSKNDALREQLEVFTMDQLLKVWEWTENAKNDEIPLIRERIMNELERRNPLGFNAWLDQDTPKDMDLRLYMRVNPMCLNCELWQAECTGTNEWAYTGCVRKKNYQ